MPRQSVQSNSEPETSTTEEARELAATFSALEFATVGLDAVSGALGDLGAAVEGAARSANMERRALLAERYAALRENISVLDAARKRGLETILGGAENAVDLAPTEEPSAMEPAFDLIDDVDGFRDAALIEAAKNSIALARESLERVASAYRERASEIADRLVVLGQSLPEETDGQSSGDTARDTDSAKRASLRSRILRGLLGERAA